MKKTNLEKLHPYLLKAEALMVNGLVSGSFSCVYNQDQVDKHLSDIWGVTDDIAIFIVAHNGLSKSNVYYYLTEEQINQGQLTEGGVIIDYEGKTVKISILCTIEAPAPIEEHPNYNGFIRAFWRRIEPFKNQYGKELPKELPDEFIAHMATAGLLLQQSPHDIDTDK